MFNTLSHIAIAIGIVFILLIAIIRAYLYYLDTKAIGKVKAHLASLGYDYVEHKKYSSHNRVTFSVNGTEYQAKFRFPLFQSELVWVDGSPEDKVFN